MSEIKTNKISPRKGTTTTITDSGDTVTVTSGASINNAGTLTINNLTNSGTLTSTGTLTTAGISGGTINNSGSGSITGLQQQINWQTGSIKTASFTASANEGYFLNTTSGEITVTLPASPSAGDVVAVKDYADTFDTNKAILNPNGNKIQGAANNFHITVEGTAAVFLYIDSTQGWKLVDQSKAADISEDAKFIVATGGTITTCGNFKIHTFTSPGTFSVSCAGNPAGGPSSVDYLVVAGGGGGAGAGGCTVSAGGAGAGGHRTSFPSCGAGSIPVSVTSYPITVGGGGSGGPGSPAPDLRGSDGSNSIFSTITSAGGGRGGQNNAANNGGSGGGSSYSGGSIGNGNTPPVSPPQGNPGGATNNGSGGSGGGGIGASGSAHPGGTFPNSPGANGGNGTANSITGSSVTRAGGGGGGAFVNNFPSGSNLPGGSGGSGGGGNGGSSDKTNAGSPGGNATANTGGGGGGSGSGGTTSPINHPGGSGGSGIVIIRYKFQ